MTPGSQMRLRKVHVRGFTLIELLVALSVLGVLLLMAVPSFRDAGLPSQLRAVANDLAGATQLARSEAIKRNAVVTLCVSAGGTECESGNWQQGWIVLSGTTVLHHELPAPTGYRVTPTGGASSLSFQPVGVGATAETFTICRSTPRVGSQERVVTVSATGRASVKTTMSGVCP
jgi:type IV fimbrial biogenesis protein FimT